MGTDKSQDFPRNPAEHSGRVSDATSGASGDEHPEDYWPLFSPQVSEADRKTLRAWSAAMLPAGNHSQRLRRFTLAFDGYDPIGVRSELRTLWPLAFLFGIAGAVVWFLRQTFTPGEAAAYGALSAWMMKVAFGLGALALLGALTATSGFSVRVVSHAERRARAAAGRLHGQYLIPSAHLDPFGLALLRRARAAATEVTASRLCAEVLDATEHTVVLSQQVWDLATDLVELAGARAALAAPRRDAGPATKAVLRAREAELVERTRALGARVAVLEAYAAQVAALDTRYRDIMTARALAAAAATPEDLGGGPQRDRVARDEIGDLAGALPAVRDQLEADLAELRAATDNLARSQPASPPEESANQ